MGSHHRGLQVIQEFTGNLPIQRLSDSFRSSLLTFRLTSSLPTNEPAFGKSAPSCSVSGLSPSWTGQPARPEQLCLQPSFLYLPNWGPLLKSVHLACAQFPFLQDQLRVADDAGHCSLIVASHNEALYLHRNNQESLQEHPRGDAA